jgi:hypothetical protein
MARKPRTRTLLLETVLAMDPSLADDLRPGCETEPKAQLRYRRDGSVNAIVMRQRDDSGRRVTTTIRYR